MEQQSSCRSADCPPVAAPVARCPLQIAQRTRFRALRLKSLLTRREPLPTQLAHSRAAQHATLLPSKTYFDMRSKQSWFVSWRLIGIILAKIATILRSSRGKVSSGPLGPTKNKLSWALQCLPDPGIPSAPLGPTQEPLVCSELQCPRQPLRKPGLKNEHGLQAKLEIGDA